MPVRLTTGNIKANTPDRSELYDHADNNEHGIADALEKVDDRVAAVRCYLQQRQAKNQGEHHQRKHCAIARDPDWVCRHDVHYPIAEAGGVWGRRQSCCAATQRRDGALVHMKPAEK
jgi:hypothetical protein